MTFFLFPGQGSQSPGMGKTFYDASPEAQVVFKQAESKLGADFLSLIFEGEPADLNLTINAQPALLTVECAIAAHLKAQGILPSGCAGHSLGEIPALVAAEAVSFEDALGLTCERGRLMSENIPAGGMAAVLGLAPEVIESHLPEGVQIANYNGPGQTIISGAVDALSAAQEALKEAGAKRVLPLKVSGPFHSEFMRPAAEQFTKVLAEVPFRAPVHPFISSVSAQRENDPERIRTLLSEQLYSPVRWTQVLAQIEDAEALEVGPGNVLSGMARRIEGAPKIALAGTLDALNEL